MDQHRSQRVSEAVREELSEIIGFELSDPRLTAVDVTDVKVSVAGGEQEQNAAMAALEHAGHFLRHELAGRLNLRRIPELHFERENWPDASARVEILLKRAKKKRGTSENQP